MRRKFDAPGGKPVSNDVSNEARVEHDRDLVECFQPARRIQLPVREQMKFARIQNTVAVGPAMSPSKGNGPLARADGESVALDVVFRQLLRREAMLFDHDATPAEGHC